MTPRRALLILVAGVLTGMATEFGKEVAESEQFRRAILWMLHWDQGEPGHQTHASPPAPKGRSHERPASPTPDGEEDWRLPARLKCKSSDDTPWQHEANVDALISKCVGHSYFGFQCSRNRLVLVTNGVHRLMLAKFFRYEHLDGYDVVLVAQETGYYYYHYYPLTRQIFTVFREALYVLLTQHNGDVLYLELTNVKHLSNLAFSKCVGT